MSYYLIGNYDVIDQEMFEQYSQQVWPLLMQDGLKVLVADDEPKFDEGKSHQILVILEFESEELAMQWYNSPEYQAIINLRLNSTEGWGRGAPQFVMPST